MTSSQRYFASFWIKSHLEQSCDDAYIPVDDIYDNYLKDHPQDSVPRGVLSTIIRCTFSINSGRISINKKRCTTYIGLKWKSQQIKTENEPVNLQDFVNHLEPNWILQGKDENSITLCCLTNDFCNGHNVIKYVNVQTNGDVKISVAQAVVNSKRCGIPNKTKLDNHSLKTFLKIVSLRPICWGYPNIEQDINVKQCKNWTNKDSNGGIFSRSHNCFILLHEGQDTHTCKACTTRRLFILEELKAQKQEESYLHEVTEDEEFESNPHVVTEDREFEGQGNKRLNEQQLKMDIHKDSKCMQCQNTFVKRKHGYKRKSLQVLRDSWQYRNIQGLVENLLQKGGHPSKSFVCEKCIGDYRTSVRPPKAPSSHSSTHLHSKSSSRTSHTCTPNKPTIPEIPIEIRMQKHDHSYGLAPPPPQKPVKPGTVRNVRVLAKAALRRSNYRRLIRFLYEGSKKFKQELQTFINGKIKREIRTFSKKMKPYKNWSDLMKQSIARMPLLTSTIEAAVPEEMHRRDIDSAARVGVVTSILCFSNNHHANQFQKMASYQLWKHGCDQKMMTYLNQLGLAVSAKTNQVNVKKADKREQEQWDKFFSSKATKRSISACSPTQEEEENNDTSKQRKVDHSICRDNSETDDQPQPVPQPSASSKSEEASRRSIRRCQKKVLGKEWMTEPITDHELLYNSSTSAQSLGKELMTGHKSENEPMRDTGISAQSIGEKRMSEHKSSNNEQTGTSVQLISDNKEPRDTSAWHISDSEEPIETSARHISDNKEPIDTSARHISENKEPRDTSAPHISDSEEPIDTSSQRNNYVDGNVLYLGEDISQTWTQVTESDGTVTFYNGKVPRLLSETDGAAITSYSLIDDDQENVSDSEDVSSSCSGTSDFVT